MAVKGWRGMVAAALAGGLLAGIAGVVRADGDDEMEKKAQRVLITLGSKDNKMTFSPDKLMLETGKLYKLVLFNGGPVTHEFDSAALAEAVYSYKAEVISPEGVELAELVGSFKEIEVAPGAMVEWYFVPVKPLVDGDILCDMPGHLAAGMKARVTVKAAK